MTVNSYDNNATVPRIGTLWVWEVKWNGEEWWVGTVDHKLAAIPRALGNRPIWNDLGRFWEAVSPIGTKVPTTAKQRVRAEPDVEFLLSADHRKGEDNG